MKLISTAMALVYWIGTGVPGFGASIGPIQPPVVVTCPDPIVADCSGPDGTVVKFTPTATSTAGRITAITAVPVSGGVFPLGVTTVKVTAVDALRNSAQCSFTVTVRDTIPPEMTVPGPIEINCAPAGGTTVDFTVTATDNCDSNLIPVCHPPSGSLFPIGTTTVQCIVRDGSGNATTKSFDVTLRKDTNAPVITVPEPIVVNCAPATGVKVEFVATALDDCSGVVNVLCQPSSGSTFKVGTSTVIARAVDAAGNVASKNFAVTVNGDTIPPVLSLPATISAACTSPAGAVVNFNLTAEDACDGPVVVLCTPPSGSQFPMGKTTVDCVATDKVGNSVHGTFDVIVSTDCAKDCVTLTCPGDITMECAAVTGRAVEFAAQAASRCSTAPPTITYTKAPGSIFPLGKTIVTCTAVDDKGNTAACQFTVTIVDATAPVFGSLPSPKAECTSPQGAVVTFEATAIDQCDGIISATCTPPGGSLFPIGTTTVTAAAMDTSGNKSTVSFNVVVTGGCLSDCIAVTCPGDITVSLVQGNDIQVEYPAATATNTCTGQPITASCYPPSGSVFHAGKTKVDCMAIDLGTRQNCQFTVTVLDPIPPKFRRLPTITKECDGMYSGVGNGISAPKGGAFVSYTITATDNADPSPVVVCNPASGSFFPLGTNIVTCTATDASGNSATSSFKVVVISGPACELSADAGGLGLEPPDNWGFELGLVSWKGTGSAMATNIQPILGDRVATIRIGDVKKNIEQKLGGDYWHDVTYPIGYKGQRWIGTAEGQIFGLPFVGEELTGTLLSKRFIIKHKYINFLMGGGADLGNLKAEVLVRTGVAGPQNELIDGDYYTRANVATGHAEEIMHRLEWGVSAYINKYAYIRLVDSSTTGHINVDDFRFSDIPVEQQQVRVGDKYYPAVINFNGFDFDWDAPVWGFGDLHTHPFSYLGFGGKIVHGEFYGDLTDCRCSHGGWGVDNTCGNYWRQLLQVAMDDKGNDAHGFGIVGPNQSENYDQYWPWKQFRSWPTFSSVTHQQMYRDWLKRAYDGGLRVLVALCVNNQLLAHAARGNLPGDDKAVSELQIKALRDWVEDDNLFPKYSFVEIAYDPIQLRDIVRRNKLAIIIGSELDDFGNFASNPLIDPQNPSETARKIVRDEVDRMYDKLGVRYIFPIHLMDNTFGGTAIGSDMLNFATKYLMGKAFSVVKADESDQINFHLSDFNTVKINIDGKNFSFDPGVLAVVGTIAGSILIPALGPIVGAVADAMFPVAPGSGAALGAGLGPIMTVAMIGALPVLVAAIADTPIPLDIAPLPGNYPSYPDKGEAPYGVRNKQGLTPLGQYAIDYMMKRGIMIDVDHMSQKALNEMVQKAEAVPGGYPVNSGHNSFRDLGLEVNENHRSTFQMDKIRKLGGMMGVGWENGPAHDFDTDDQVFSQSSIDNDCAGTSKTFSQNYLFALEQMHGSHVAFGTDMDGLIAAPGPRFGPQSAFALPSPDNENLIDSDHTTLDRAWDIGRQTDGVAYSPKHGKPLTTAAFVGNAVDPNKNTEATSYSKSYRYNQDQRDFYAALRIFFWFKHRDEGIPSENQTDYDLEQIKNGFHDSYPDKDRIKRYAFGAIKGMKNWDLHNDEEQIGRAVVRTRQNNEGVPDYLDSSDKRKRYYRMLDVWDDYVKIFGGNAPLFRCSYDKKEWDYNFEGVAHYGLLPDFLQDLTNVGMKPKDMGVLFKSAEDFAQMWVKTLNAADQINHPSVRVPQIGGGILKLQWYAEDGDELEESDQIGDPSSWRHLPVDLTPGTRQAEANVQLNNSRARFFRVKKK